MDRPTPDQPAAVLVPPSKPASPRYPLLDVLRVVAMLDIISIHINYHYLQLNLGGLHLVCGLGLPIFIITAVALSVRKPELPGFAELPGAARKRASRVLLPWLVWVGFFAVNRVVWSWTAGRDVGEFFYPWMFGAGTSIHLWFLPFIFVAELVVLAALVPLRRLPAGVVIAGALGLAVFFVWLTGRVYDWAWPVYGGMKVSPEDYDQSARLFGWWVRKSWLFGTASVCLGVALGRTLSLSSTAALRWLLVGAAALFVLYFLWRGLNPKGQGFDRGPIHGHAVWQWWRQFGALLCVALAVQLTGKTPKWVYRFAVLTMGVYLLHGWVDARVMPIFERRVGYFWQVTQNPWSKVIVVWLLTAGLAALLRRTPARRVL